MALGMRNKLTKLAAGYLGLVFVMALGSPVEAQFGRAVQPIEFRIPASAKLLVTMQKPDIASARWQKTALGGLVTSPTFGPFLKALGDQHIASPLHLRPWVGLDWADIASFKTPVAVAVLPDADKHFSVCLILDATSQAQALKAALAQADAYFASCQAKRTTEKIAAGELVIYEFVDAVSGLPQKRVQVTIGETLVAASSRSTIDILLAHWNDKDMAGKPILHKSTYKSVQAETKKLLGAAAADFTFYAEPIPLGELIKDTPWDIKKDPKARGQKDWLAIAKRQGFDVCTAVGGAAVLTPAAAAPATKLDMQVYGVVLAKGPYKDSMRMLTFLPGANLATPAWVEATANNYSVWHWDFKQALEGMGTWADEVTGGPEAKGTFDDIIENLKLDPNGPLLDVRKEVFARLGTGIFKMGDQLGKADAEKNPHGRRFVYQIQAKQTAALELEKSFTKLFAEDVKLGNIEKSSNGGATLWSTIKLDSLFDYSSDEADAPAAKGSSGKGKEKAGGKGKLAPTKGPKIKFLAVTKDYLLLSSDKPLILAAIANKPAAKPLTADASFARVAALHKGLDGPNSSLRWFGQFQSVFGDSYELVRNGKVVEESDAQAVMWQLLLLGTSSSKPTLPHAKLPPYAAIEASLAPGGIHLSVTPEGFTVNTSVLAK